MDEKEYREARRRLETLLSDIQTMHVTIGSENDRIELSRLEAETMRDGFWNDKDRFAEVNKKITEIKRKIIPWDDILREVKEASELLGIAVEESDEALANEMVSGIEGLERRFEELETRELMSDEDDPKNAYITIHPGAGGTESQDWASMLFRMYFRWAESYGFKVDVLDYTPGEEAGIKSATLHVKGDYAYGYLKAENGVHRLVRISPFDANKRRHTSFASVESVPEIDEDVEVEINESDLRIDTYRATGAGGQHINTTDSAVRITHNPTGIVVQCQNERSQHKNKAFAMKLLKTKLYELQKEQAAEKLQDRIGERKEISWGNQIRSYVFQPYTLVKDHRTGHETGTVEKVFDGDIGMFIHSYLKMLKSNV